MQTSMEELFGPPIHVVTRQQLIEDGNLVDLSEWASTRQMMGGFTIPVAVTRSVWAMIENIPQTPRCSYQDVRGRAHDVLWMASLAARRNPDRSQVLFQVIMDVTGTRKRYQTLKLVCGANNDGSPCITLLQPHED